VFTYFEQSARLAMRAAFDRQLPVSRAASVIRTHQTQMT